MPTKLHGLTDLSSIPGLPSVPGLSILQTTPTLRLQVASSDALDVRTFSITEGLSELFSIRLTVVSQSSDVDIEAIVGKPATFQVDEGLGFGVDGGRSWKGICKVMELVRVEGSGLSTYELEIVPRMWLLSQGRNYRAFQQQSEPQIALEILAQWDIAPDVRLAMTDYKERNYRVQYGESDFTFVSRLLEDAGITYFFEQAGEDTKIVFTDRSHQAPPRPQPIPYAAVPPKSPGVQVVTNLRVGKQVRPGKYTLRDVDYRKPPTVPLMVTADMRAPAGDIDGEIERYHFVPGVLHFRAKPDASSPVADDHGTTRTDIVQGQVQAQRRLEAKRGSARLLTFDTTARDLAPGEVFSIASHPRRELGEDKLVLVVRATLEGDSSGEWHPRVEARFADIPFRPALVTPKPRVHGVDTATVVGPPGQEIHTDEFGRVRVQFHWDREGAWDEKSSIWVPVSQAWGGGTMGSLALPRVGQRVLMSFLGGDPDRPLVTGRVFTQDQRVPYALPAHKEVTSIRTESSPRGAPFPAPPQPGPRSSPLGGGTGMSMADIAQAVEAASPFAPASPSGTTHRWNGSELSFSDVANNESVYLQAQRNFSSLIKHDRIATIGNTSAERIGGDHLMEIGNKQDIKVADDQTIAVGGHHTLTVQKTLKTYSINADQYHYAKESYGIRAKRVYAEADEELTLRVGNSVIFMRPDFIIIESGHVFINPGQPALAAAMESGVRPETPTEIAARSPEAIRQAAWERFRRSISEMTLRPQDREYLHNLVTTHQRGRGGSMTGDVERDRRMLNRRTVGRDPAVDAFLDERRRIEGR